MQQVFRTAAFLFAIVPTVLFAQTNWDSPSLGFECISIDEFTAFVNNPRIKVPGKVGVVVVDVAPNGPSAGKLNVFDIIIKIDQTQIRNVSDIEGFVKTLKLGQECLVSGHGATMQNGLPKWKKANTKLGPAKAHRQVFIDALVTTVDSVTDTTTYRHPHTPERMDTDTNLALIIRKEKGGQPTLFVRFSNVGNLLFTRELIFKIDGKTQRVTVNPNFDIADESEWDVLSAESQKELVKSLIATKQAVTVRSNGSKEFLDRDLSLTEIYAMRGVYQAFLAMGGKPL